MDKIRELLSRLGELTAEELSQLRSLIVEEFDSLDKQDATAEVVSAQSELADAAGKLQAEETTREQAKAEAEAQRETARAAVQALNPDADAEGEKPEEPEANAEEPEGEAEQVQEPAMAATGTVRRMAARQPKPSNSTAGGEVQRTVLTASGHLRGRENQIIADRDDLARSMADLLNRMPKSGTRGDVIVASAHFKYPEDRKLGDDAFENGRKIDAVTNPNHALVATGGICAPVNVDYSVPTWATADRPLRDGLPAFEATRGGIRYVQPPTLASTSSATGVWTAATDANPAGATKPVLQVACGTEEQALVNAIATRLGFGNMQSRFAPEQIAANTDLAMAEAARIAENELLALLEAACVADITTAKLLGAARDLVSTILKATTAYRNAYRIPRSQVITAIFPDWVKELIKADLAQEIGHAQDSSWNSLMITDQQVEDLLSNAGVRPIFHLDGQPAEGSGGATYPSQLFVAPTASSAFEAFPTKMVWYMFPEGQIQFLDGGRLDLGVVRDATLDATNDYETFVETFEGLAFRGFSGGAWQFVSELCANGGSAGTVDTSTSCL